MREGTKLFENFENFGKLHANLTRPIFTVNIELVRFVCNSRFYFFARYLVFEFVDKNLLEVLEMFPTGLDPESVRLIVYQLVKAIEYCHAHDVIHR